MKEHTGQSDNYNLLLGKLRDFTRKYYFNQILRGGIYFAALFLISYLSVALGEYFGHFGTGTRTAMFYTFLGLNVFILGRYIILPVLKIFDLGKTLTYTQAADIIGKHFAEVKDKLLNTLQLREQASNLETGFQKQLIEASINQKITELKPVPFVKAVDYNNNRKYLKYALIPLAAFLLLLAISPHMLLESTERLVAHNQYFAEKAPFEFVLENDSLVGIRQEDFALKMHVKGREIPAEMFVVIDGNPYKMSALKKTAWSYTLKNLMKDHIEIEFSANGYTSEPHTLKVLSRPALQKFEVRLQYPAYLKKHDDVLSNVGDLTVPAGTKINWRFYTENTEEVSLLFKNQQAAAERKGTNLFTWQGKFMQDDQYFLKIRNKNLGNNDSIQYALNVIQDAAPSIQVIQEQDSAHLKNQYFTGQVSDDYGFSKLTFNYHYTKTTDSSKSTKKLITQSLAINGDKIMQPFYHYWDASELNIQPGEELEYYFEVWDNDGVNGPKSSRSEKFFFKAPTEEELEKNAEASNTQVQDKLSNAVKQSTQLQKSMQDIRMRLMNKQQTDWQDKKAIEDLLKQQEGLKNTIEDLKKEFNDNLKKQEEFSKQDEELLQKQKELQEMFDKMMDPETKKLMDELRKLLDENMKDQMQQKMEDMKVDNKEVQKELERMSELFKQFEFEQKLDKNIEKLDKMAKEQDDLSKKSEEKNADAKDLEKKQDDLNKKFEDFKKDMDELKNKNDELEKKHDLKDTKPEQEQIQEDQKESKESLQKKDNKKAAKKQKSAADKMKKMSEKMNDMKESMKEKEDGEDYQALRQILDNLVYLSFEQEKLMNDLKAKPNYSPEYIDMGQRQRKLKDDAKMIEDSLFALSKRVTELKSFVNKEIGLINANMDKTVADMAARNTPQARSHQQFVMTSVNNLAVMLSESLKKMQDEMNESQSSKPGDKQCKMPGNKKGKGKGKGEGKGKGKGQGEGDGEKMKSMRQMQQQLNKQIQAMKEQMKNGQKPGQKPGQGGQEGLSKELAQSAARQEAIRRELQRLNEMKQRKGQGMNQGLNDLQKQMDSTEEDLVNRRITDRTLKRQQDIMVRMIESENAQKEQDESEKRKSKTADQIHNATPPSLEKYRAMKEKETELLHTVPPTLNTYYRLKVKEYFQGVK